MRTERIEVTPSEVVITPAEGRSHFHVDVHRGLTEARRRAVLRPAFHAWLRAWLRARAFRNAREFCTCYVQWLGEEYVGVELNDHQDMWGTCEKNDVRRINWGLTQAPKFAREYVCAHEVCDLVHRHYYEPFGDVLGEVMVEWEVLTFEWGRAL